MLKGGYGAVCLCLKILPDWGQLGKKWVQNDSVLGMFSLIEWLVRIRLFTIILSPFYAKCKHLSAVYEKPS